MSLTMDLCAFGIATRVSLVGRDHKRMSGQRVKQMYTEGSKCQLTTITSSSSDSAQSIGVSTRAVNSIIVTFQSINERFCKHSLELCSGESTLIFSRLCEWMQVRIEVALDWRWCSELRWKNIVKRPLDH